MVGSRHIREALEELNRQEEKVLIEDLGHWAKKNYKNVFGVELSEDEFNTRICNISLMDPSFKSDSNDVNDMLKKPQGIYTQWLLKLIKRKVYTYEQMMENKDHILDVLTHFDDLKTINRIPQDKRDLMSSNANMNSIEDMEEVINNVRGEETEENDGSFKSVVKNIRNAIRVICKFNAEDIPVDIQRTSDCLKFIAENSKWEVWEITSIWGAMIMDCWGISQGGGATWCIGGQYHSAGHWRWGTDLVSSAYTHYRTYNHNNGHYIVFQQKDVNATRPTNKYLVTLKSDYSASQADFDHADDCPVTVSGWHISPSSDRGEMLNNRDETLAIFLVEENLASPLQNTDLKNNVSVLMALKNEELKQSGHYTIESSQLNFNIPRALYSAIKFIDITNENDEIVASYEVDDFNRGAYCSCTSLDEFNEIQRFLNGEPYVMHTNKVNLREEVCKIVTKVVVTSSYNDSTGGIPTSVKKFTNLKLLVLPESVSAIRDYTLSLEAINKGLRIELEGAKRKIHLSSYNKNQEDYIDYIKKHVFFVSTDLCNELD